MAKIRVSCKNRKMTFSISPINRDIDKSNLNLTQTNIINTDSMIFTSNYMLNNSDLVASFITGLAIQKNINQVYIKDQEILSLVLLIIQNIKTFEEVYIESNEPVSYDIYERLLYSPYIKYINCYSMKHFMIEKFDNKDVIVDIRKEMFFLSNFMEENNLKYYSSIYYKKTLDIKNNFTKEDIEDFEIFCRINKYLKTINLHHYSREMIRTILSFLIKYKIKNITIKIFENKDNNLTILDSIEYLRTIQNQMKKENNYRFKIIYSNEYKSENFMKQLNLTNLKLSSLIIIIIIGLGLIIMEYNGHVSETNIEKLNEIIKEEVNKVSDEIVLNKTLPPIKVNGDEQEIDVETPIDSTKAYVEAFKGIFDTLQEKNKDTIGWIKVNNTNIEYPVVQTKDNDYYLHYDFNKKKNTFGWIFMDYRNNPVSLDQNTIIYGHNSTRRKIMFSALIDTMQEEWYVNKTNQIITFNTPHFSMEWQIFSIYPIKVTSDYLYTNFNNQKEFTEFSNKLKSRSIYDFDIPVTNNDRILTLSSCLNSGSKRLVVHAKLIRIINNSIH